MSTYLGDPEQDKWIAEMKAEKKRREIQDDSVEEIKQKKVPSFLDCDGDTMIGRFMEVSDDPITFTMNDTPVELFRIEQTDVGGDVRLEAGQGTKEDGDIYFKASGKTLSLTNLLEIIQSLGYDHLIEKDKDQEIHCDFEGAMSILGK